MPDVVSNSTPLIALLSIGKLDILNKLYGKIIIPDAVNCELSAKNREILKDIDFIEIMKIKNIAS